MNLLSWASLFLFFGVAFGRRCYPSLGMSYTPCQPPSVSGSDGSSVVVKPPKGNPILPCEPQQYKAGSPRHYVVTNVPDEFQLMLMDFNITTNEKLLIKTFKCDFYINKCAVAVIDDGATPPFFVTMNKNRFTLFSSSVSVTFRVDDDCSQACVTENTSSCTPDTGSCKSHGDSWRCECKPGYENEEGNDQKCVDINECESYEGGLACPSFAGSCTNLIGSYTCDCYEAYQHPASGSKQKCESVFYLFSGPANFTQAKTLCEGKGGHLATILSQAESDSLLIEVQWELGEIWDNEKAAFLGLSQVSDIHYQWVTGEVIEVDLSSGGSASPDGFVNFYLGRGGDHYDKDGRDDRDCIYLFNDDGTWGDERCSKEENFYTCKIIHP